MPQKQTTLGVNTAICDVDRKVTVLQGTYGSHGSWGGSHTGAIHRIAQQSKCPAAQSKSATGHPLLARKYTYSCWRHASKLCRSPGLLLWLALQVTLPSQGLTATETNITWTYSSGGVTLFSDWHSVGLSKHWLQTYPCDPHICIDWGCCCTSGRRIGFSGTNLDT